MCWIRRRLKGLFFIRHFCFREAEGNCGEENVMGLLMEKRKNRVYAAKIKKVVRGAQMYKHHEESLQIMTGYYREQKGVIAFICVKSYPAYTG